MDHGWVEWSTKSETLMRPSRRESLLMLSLWNSMRSLQAWPGFNKCWILSPYTSMASTLWSVSHISLSHKWDPMNPPAPIMQILSGWIGCPSKFNLGDAIATQLPITKANTRSAQPGVELDGCGAYNGEIGDEEADEMEARESRPYSGGGVLSPARRKRPASWDAMGTRAPAVDPPFAANLYKVESNSMCFLGEIAMCCLGVLVGNLLIGLAKRN